METPFLKIIEVPPISLPGTSKLIVVPNVRPVDPPVKDAPPIPFQILKVVEMPKSIPGTRTIVTTVAERPHFPGASVGPDQPLAIRKR